MHIVNITFLFYLNLFDQIYILTPGNTGLFMICFPVCLTLWFTFLNMGTDPPIVLFACIEVVRQ